MVAVAVEQCADDGVAEECTKNVNVNKKHLILCIFFILLGFYSNRKLLGNFCMTIQPVIPLGVRTRC